MCVPERIFLLYFYKLTSVLSNINSFVRELMFDNTDVNLHWNELMYDNANINLRWSELTFDRANINSFRRFHFTTSADKVSLQRELMFNSTDVNS